MKRDRKKGAGPEYEDLLYDETPSVVVYYPSKGENPDAPEPTRKRDRSTAFVPDLTDLDPLTREQPAVGAEGREVTELFPGRGEAPADPAKPVPASLQSRGVLAWDPTHRDPGEDDAFSAFFRPESAGGAPTAAVAGAEDAAESTREWQEPLQDDRPTPPPPAPAAVRQGPDFRPVVFDTDIISADFIEADAIRADPPRVTPFVPAAVVAELPVVPEAPPLPAPTPVEASPELQPEMQLGTQPMAEASAQAEVQPEAIDFAGFGRPVEVRSAAGAEIEPVAELAVVESAVVESTVVVSAEVDSAVVESAEVETPLAAGGLAADAFATGAGLGYAGVGLSAVDDPGPDTQMRFLQEWEADLSGSQGLERPSRTGRLFRSVRAEEQSEALPALRREQAARFASLAAIEEPAATSIGESPLTSTWGEEPLIEREPEPLRPRVSAQEASIWKASSMSGMTPVLVYLIPLAATMLVGLANALFLGPGIGWPTGVALVVSSLVGALRVRMVDASVAVIAPPLAFLAAALTAGQIGMSTAGGPLIGLASNLFFALSTNVIWILAATLLSLAVVLFRARRERDDQG